jgi:cyclopropane fatty-acyl-phospholipid synthase-like methyltransferase
MSPPVAPGFSEACERNKAPILEALRTAFASASRVLEIGSGTGQHAVWFARHLPHLLWQPSDVAAALPALAARLRAEAPANVLPPTELDVAVQPWRVGTYDAIFSANTLHIVSWDDVGHFFRGVGAALEARGTLCVYGPFRYRGDFTTPSNAAFDQWLKQRDPVSGIRDFEAVDALAAAEGLALVADHAMPANNQALVWRRERLEA